MDNVRKEIKMKIFMKSVFLVLIVVISGSNILFAQNESENSVKSTLNKLFEFSKSKSYEKAAAYIAYEGEDKNRIGKESFNAANKDELNMVKRKLKKISALLEISNKHEFGKFSTSQTDGKDIFSIEIEYFSNDQKIIETYSFIKTEKGFLLIR